jgi:cytochrome c oxidase subunit 4
MIERVHPIRIYVVVTGVLLALTGLTVALAHVSLGSLNAPLALLIAALKAALIALFFMHLRWSQPLVRIVAMAAVFWLAILMVGTMDDIVTRSWLPIGGK